MATLGGCIDSERCPASIRRLSPHSAGWCVAKVGLLPACIDVNETAPARSSVKLQFGQNSAVECGFIMGVLNGSRLVLLLGVSSETSRLHANMVISTRRAKVASVVPLEIMAKLAPCRWI